MLGAKPWLIEPSLIPMPWRRGPFDWLGANNKIRIGVMRDDGLVRPLPPMARAIDEVATALEKSGQFEMVDYQPYRHDLAVALAVRVLIFCPQAGIEHLYSTNATL